MILSAASDCSVLNQDICGPTIAGIPVSLGDDAPKSLIY
jgi:hypothetical protein